jgi:ABC-type transporter Mla maintaining outer membrane lipid asymmetry ATPase subunit MlaF
MSAVLGYEPRRDGAAPERVWFDAPGSHRLTTACKDELLAALHDFRPRTGARLVLFGADVAALGEAERSALMRRAAFVPANGGLMSSLNAWENISLPVAYHAPHELPGAAREVRALLKQLGGVGEDLLAKLPEHMTLYERRLAAYIRALLENPELLVMECVVAGLGPTKRRRAERFSEVYQARRPGGTFVQLDA